MKSMILKPLLLSVLFLFPELLAAGAEPLKDGDLIFIVNPNGQGKSIQIATGSRYTHVGIVFIENGKPVVYHAVEPVSKNTLDEFLDFSSDGKYEIRRLKDQSLLNPATISRMKKMAESKLGIHYDLVFGWDDTKLYCSELVWKIYNSCLMLQIGDPRALKEFNITHPAVRAKLTERYGSKIPLEEKMISPGDMFDSSLLE